MGRIAVEHVGAKHAPGIGPFGVDAVVGRAHDDGLEVGRILDRDLPLDHAAVGFPQHAHVAVAPGLGGDPLHHFVSVAPFVVGIDVMAPPAGVPRAAHVELHHHVAPLRQIGNGGWILIPVVRQGSFDPPVGVVFHDGRESSLRVRPRDSQGQLHAVPHGDIPVDQLDLALVNGRGEFCLRLTEDPGRKSNNHENEIKHSRLSNESCLQPLLQSYRRRFFHWPSV